MQLEELMYRCHVTEWDSTRISRKGNLVLTGSWDYHIDPNGESCLGYASVGTVWAVVDPKTNRVLHSHTDESSWDY